jgi:hypothetical protein
VDAETIRIVRDRAVGLCEYCQLPAALHPAPFQTDHIIARQHCETAWRDSMARQHGGTDHPDNLALACIHCNRYKGPNIAGIDPETDELTRLFHPRTDVWNHHFTRRGAEILPLSDIGRVTARVLNMNDPEVLWLRETLALEAAARSQRR